MRGEGLCFENFGGQRLRKAIISRLEKARAWKRNSECQVTLMIVSALKAGTLGPTTPVPAAPVVSFEAAAARPTKPVAAAAGSVTPLCRRPRESRRTMHNFPQ